MEEFKVEDFDGVWSRKLKKEASIALASLDKNSNDYLYKRNAFSNALSICKSIERIEWNNDKDLEFVLNTVRKIMDVGLLSPLTLNDNEFEKNPLTNIEANIRYNQIIKTNQGIFNFNAYHITIRARYNHDNKRQVFCRSYTSNAKYKLFLSKGGVITGEYIYDCIIRQDIVDKGCFTIQSVVNIPVSVINYKTEDNPCASLFVVDHREPKLKALREFYDVPILFDENIKNKKFNLRTYEKLK